MLLPEQVFPEHQRGAIPRVIMDARTSPAPTISVSVIEDQAPIRDAFAELLSTSAGFALAGAYASVEGALAHLPDNLPKVYLIDLVLPGMSGIGGIRLLRTRWPKVNLLALTVHEENSYIFEALCAGADGYLLKSTPANHLLQCIREAVAGGAPMSPSIAAKVIGLLRETRPAATAQTDLTPHEFRILKLLASGENYKSSAQILKVSVNTISFHVRSIYSKLHVHSRSEAVAKALRTGIIV